MPEPLSERARGRWRGILPDLGVPLAFLNGKHQPCPLCGGKDRARFDDKEGRGTYFCGQCGAGNGIDLVMKLCSVDFKGAAELIEPLICSAPRQQPRPDRSADDQRNAMKRLWDGAVPILADDPAGVWLRARTGITLFPNALRYHDRVAATAADNGVRAPAMLAKVTDHHGTPVNLHRTFLTLDGAKAPLAKQRAVMPGSLPEGSAVRLFPRSETLGIAEGIETAIAAFLLFDVPCWAALNAGLLAKWGPPPGVRQVFVFGDNDASFTGQRAAFELANRLAKAEHLSVDVQIPAAIGEDWNDVLLREHISASANAPAAALRAMRHADAPA